jgi:hypothetical protein
MQQKAFPWAALQKLFHKAPGKARFMAGLSTRLAAGCALFCCQQADAGIKALHQASGPALQSRGSLGQVICQSLGKLGQM